MERSTILRQLMLEKEMKVADISKKSGISYSTVKSILENGIEKASYINICKICIAIGITPDELEQRAKNNNTPKKFTEKDLLFLEKYHFVNQYSPDGISVIDTVLDREYCIATQLKERSEYIQNTERPVSDSENIMDMRPINYYYRVASAGTGQIIFDMPPTKRVEIPNIPKYRKVDYAIGVNGNSMEPTYHDGDMLLVEMTEEIEVGEIGIFRVDNESYVKKLGKTELISLNPAAENIPLNETAGCMGKVIGKLP